MIKELIKLADHLDKKGFKKEADYLDLILTKLADGLYPDNQYYVNMGIKNQKVPIIYWKDGKPQSIKHDAIDSAKATKLVLNIMSNVLATDIVEAKDIISKLNKISDLSSGHESAGSQEDKDNISKEISSIYDELKYDVPVLAAPGFLGWFFGGAKKAKALAQMAEDASSKAKTTSRAVKLSDNIIGIFKGGLESIERSNYKKLMGQARMSNLPLVSHVAADKVGKVLDVLTDIDRGLPLSEKHLHAIIGVRNYISDPKNIKVYEYLKNNMFSNREDYKKFSKILKSYPELIRSLN